MNTAAQTDYEYTLQPSRRIQLILPDDGTDRKLMHALYRDMSINRVDTVAVRAVAALQHAVTKRGLPEPVLAKLITVLVSDEQADAVFDFIYHTARIGRPGGGMLLMDRVRGSTPYVLPADIPDAEQ